MTNNRSDNRKPVRFNRSMEEQFKKIMPETKGAYAAQRPRKMVFGNVNRLGQEGVDHINLDYTSTSIIGRSLALTCNGPLQHRILGRFESLLGFWSYVSTYERDDRMRTLIGQKLRKFAKTQTKIEVQNFHAIILDAVYHRLVENSELVLLLRKSTEPFDIYNIINETGLRRRRNEAFWYVPGIEEIRTALKEEREPDFTAFMTTSGKTLEEFMIAEFIDPSAASQVEAHRAASENAEHEEEVTHVDETLAAAHEEVDETSHHDNTNAETENQDSESVKDNT